MVEFQGRKASVPAHFFSSLSSVVASWGGIRRQWLLKANPLFPGGGETGGYRIVEERRPDGTTRGGLTRSLSICLKIKFNFKKRELVGQYNKKRVSAWSTLNPRAMLFENFCLSAAPLALLGLIGEGSEQFYIVRGLEAEGQSCVLATEFNFCLL